MIKYSLHEIFLREPGIHGQKFVNGQTRTHFDAYKVNFVRSKLIFSEVMVKWNMSTSVIARWFYRTAENNREFREIYTTCPFLLND
jgi:hypothetical protein